MIKVLPLMELFQLMKRYTRQPALRFQKCYETDTIMRAGGRGPRAEDRIDLIVANFKYCNSTQYQKISCV